MCSSDLGGGDTIQLIMRRQRVIGCVCMYMYMGLHTYEVRSSSSDLSDVKECGFIEQRMGEERIKVGWAEGKRKTEKRLEVVVEGRKDSYGD